MNGGVSSTRIELHESEKPHSPSLRKEGKKRVWNPRGNPNAVIALFKDFCLGRLRVFVKPMFPLNEVSRRRSLARERIACFTWRHLAPRKVKWGYVRGEEGSRGAIVLHDSQSQFFYLNKCLFFIVIFKLEAKCLMHNVLTDFSSNFQRFQDWEIDDGKDVYWFFNRSSTFSLNCSSWI